GVMSKQTYLLGVSIGLVAIAFVVTCELVWRPGITEANARRIRLGMTRGEVEAILGGPVTLYWRSPLPAPGHKIEYWFGKDVRVMVELNGREKVVGVTIYEVITEPGPPDLLPWPGRPTERP